MNVDDRSKSFDLEAYLRGFLGSVVRFGEAAIHGQSTSGQPRNYAGWPFKQYGNSNERRN